MMTSKTIKDYIKSLFPEYRYILGFEDKGAEKHIMIAPRNGTAGLFFYGGEEQQPSQVLPLTITILYSGNFEETEQAVNAIYKALVYKNEVAYNGFVFSIFPKNNMLPVFTGRTEAGVYRFSIDIDVIYNN